MSTRSCLRLAIVLTIIALLTNSASGRPTSILDIQQLTSASDLVVVVDIESVRSLRTIEFPDQTTGQQMTASMKVDEVLKGTTGTSILEVAYEYNPDPMKGGPWTPFFRKGDHMLLFLQCAAICKLTTSEHAGFFVETGNDAVPPPAEDTPLNRVLEHLAVGLFSRVDAADPDERRASPPDLYMLSEQRGSPYVDKLLHAALDDLAPHQHANLRCDLLAALVRRGDLDLLPEVQEAFASKVGNAQAQQNMVYSLQGIDWHKTLPIAAEALRSTSSEVRTAAARAIQNLGQLGHVSSNDFAAPANHILLPFLNDPDPEVVFAVMQSLGFINGRLDKRPHTTAPDANWRECLEFWKLYQEPPRFNGQP